jgi:murein DD-endopeptidase MepM/ murein hydrolase activator NlpD
MSPRLKPLAGLLALILTPSCAGAADIRIVPADFVILNPTNPDKGYGDLLVHTVAIATGANETAKLTALRLEVLSKGRRVLTREISPEEIVGGTQFLATAPIKDFVSGQLLDRRGVDGLFGRPVAFASSPAMAPSQALLAMRLYFAVGFRPDEIRAVATLSGSNGEQTIAASVAVRSYGSPISYRAPLDGDWLIQAIPGPQSHHRFNPSTEFAVDFFKLGPDGHMAHGDKLDAGNFYGFGAPVMAAADGTVVAVISDQVQDRPAFRPRPGETPESYAKRIDVFHLAAMKKNFPAANAGNLVTLRHQNAGVVEFSSYGHLRAGSVRVQLGESVRQGEVIGEVGDTGDSPAVHLHFQLNAGPDAFNSKSLPVVFSNLEPVDRNDELGRLVTLTGGGGR